MSEDGAEATPPSAGLRPAPARPPMASALPSPLLEFYEPRPRVLVVSVGSWIASCLAGVVIVGYFVWRMDTVRSLLESSLREENPAVDDSSLQTSINVTIAIALGLVGICLALKVWLTFVMAARRNWARVQLAIVGVVAMPVTTIAATLLTDGTVESRPALLIAIITEEAFMLAGIATMFLPEPNAWFRLRLRQ